LTEANVQNVVGENASIYDLSIYDDYSVYVAPGHTTVFYFEPYYRRLSEVYGEDIPGQDWIRSHLQTSIVLDVVLIERWILTILNRQLSTLTYDLTELNAFKQSLLLALDEYHNIALTYGEAQDIVRRARQMMGTEELYQGVMQKLGILERLIEVGETRRHAWRDRLLKAGTVLVTLLLGLPVASQATKVIVGWDPVPLPSDDGWVPAVFNAVVRFTQSHPAEVTIAFYVGSLSIVLPLVLLSLLPSRARRQVISTDESGPAFAKGFTWHRGIVWHDESSDAAKQFTDESRFDRPSD